MVKKRDVLILVEHLKASKKRTIHQLTRKDTQKAGKRYTRTSHRSFVLGSINFDKLTFGGNRAGWIVSNLPYLRDFSGNRGRRNSADAEAGPTCARKRSSFAVAAA